MLGISLFLTLSQHQLLQTHLRWSARMFKFLTDQCMHHGKRNVRTLACNLFWRTRAAQKCCPCGVQTQHLPYAIQAQYPLATATPQRALLSCYCLESNLDFQQISSKHVARGSCKEHSECRLDAYRHKQAHSAIINVVKQAQRVIRYTHRKIKYGGAAVSQTVI